jgi:hypothetical protein
MTIRTRSTTIGARDLDLELAGSHVIRLSWWQVVEEPGRVVELLAKRLAEAA